MSYKNFYELDYSSIKSNLKTFLKNETTLTDYNFEGSGISNWLNIMSYVISYIGAVLNFVANELFISTSQKEANILKHAYQLNYLPRRKSAPFIEIIFTNTHTSNVIIQKYTALQMGEIKLVYLDSDVTIGAGEDVTLTLYEGEWIEETKTSDGSDFETIELDDKETVDWDKFYVYVTHSSVTSLWTSVYDDINYTDAKNYFIKYFETFKVHFDKDGGMFQKPVSGDTILIQYLKTNGATYNGYSYSTQLVFSTSFSNSDKITISLNNNVLQDGLDEESSNSIVNNAPLFYSASGRAVTEEDYNIKIKSFSLYSVFEDMFIYSSHKDYVDREYENPTELLTNESKRNLGYYMFGGLRRDTSVSMANRYTLMTLAEQQQIKDFFKPFKYMQTFGKFKHSHVWYIKNKLDVKLISDLNVEESEFRDALNAHLEEMVGYDNSFNLTEFIAFIKSFSYVDYCRVSYTNVLRIYKPRIRIAIDDNIEFFEVGHIIAGATSGTSATIVEVNETKDTIIVERGSYSGSFIDGEILTDTNNSKTATIINLYQSVVARIGTALEEQSIVSNDTLGIYDDGLGSIKNSSGAIIGTVNYETGYIEFEYTFNDTFLELLFETSNYEKVNAQLDMFLDYEELVNNSEYQDTGINYI